MSKIVISKPRGGAETGWRGSVAVDTNSQSLYEELDATVNLQVKTKKDPAKFSFSYLKEFNAFAPKIFVDLALREISNKLVSLTLLIFDVLFLVSVTVYSSAVKSTSWTLSFTMFLQ